MSEAVELLKEIVAELKKLNAKIKTKGSEDDDDDDNASDSASKPFFLPNELKTPDVLEIIERRKLSERGLLVWVRQCPSPSWFVEKLRLLDAEIEDFPLRFNEKPFPTRLREFITRHLEYEKNPKKSYAPAEVPGIIEILAAKGKKP